MYKNKESKTYALLWKKCTKGTKHKIEARTEFKSKVEKKAIELQKTINEHALNYQEDQYSMSIILDAIQKS